MPKQARIAIYNARFQQPRLEKEYPADFTADWLYGADRREWVQRVTSEVTAMGFDVVNVSLATRDHRHDIVVTVYEAGTSPAATAQERRRTAHVAGRPAGRVDVGEGAPTVAAERRALRGRGR